MSNCAKISGDRQLIRIIHTVITCSLKNSDLIRVPVDFLYSLYVASGAMVWAPFKEFVEV